MNLIYVIGLGVFLLNVVLTIGFFALQFGDYKIPEHIMFLKHSSYKQDPGDLGLKAIRLSS